MSDGDAQVEARVLCDHTAPLFGANPSQLSDSPDLLVPIRQLQVKPAGDGGDTTHQKIIDVVKDPSEACCVLAL